MSLRTVKKVLRYTSPPGYSDRLRKTSTKQHAPAALPRPKSLNARNLASTATWNAWLAMVERGETASKCDPKLASELNALLMPEPRQQRKKALVILASKQGFSVRQISIQAGISKTTVWHYLLEFREGGVARLFERKRSPMKCECPDLQNAIFALLHEPPSLSGVNRTIWRMRDLRTALAAKGFCVGADVVRQVVKNAGYRWRSAKVVLTSTDPEYREKLAHVQSILEELNATERFFSIDEYGPFSITMKAGRTLVGPHEISIVPQWKKSKGWLILTAALELSSNRVTHFYSAAKNTKEMIRMIKVLVDEYRDATKLYISWDAASWHISKALVSHIEEHNLSASSIGSPLLELAPLPASAQFLNVIESVFSGMARSIIHGSNYESKEAAMSAINQYFSERNEYFQSNPRRAGNKIWGKERSTSMFSESQNCKDPAYR